MNKEEIYNYCIENLKDSEIRKDESMKKHTSFKIGGNADVFIKISILDDLKNIIKYANDNNIKLTIIGNGSNILVKDRGIRGIVVKLDFKKINIKKVENKAIVTVGAGVSLGFLAQKLLRDSIGGFEFASGIPGTIGGAIRMNAGAYGCEFKDIVAKTKCIDKLGNIIELNNEDQNFSYRSSIFKNNELIIIIESELELEIKQNNQEIQQKMNENQDSRKLKQPINMPSAGSTFKRGEDFITAKLIDDCGLKGFSIGGAQVSNIHAGFIVNKGNATAKDVLDLVKYIKKEVYERFKKKIELEIEIIGE